MADSEPATSVDYSPPGQEYTEAIKDPQMSLPFTKKTPVITEPVTDRWGTWVSILVPIINSQNGEVFAVLGVDYPASEWKNELLYNTATTAAIFLVLIIFLSAVYLLLLSVIVRREGEKKYEYLFMNLSDAVLTLNPPDWKFSDANPAALKLFGIEEIKKLNNISPADVSPEYQEDGVSSKEKAKEMITAALRDGNNSFEWVHKSLDGSTFFSMVSLVKIKTADNEEILQATVRNINDQKTAISEIKKANEIKEKSFKETERLNKLMVGREIEMINLKKEIQDLKEKIKQNN